MESLRFFSDPIPSGPFVKPGDGRVLAVDTAQAHVSRDDGKTWTARVIVAKDPTPPGDTSPRSIALPIRMAMSTSLVRFGSRPARESCG